MTEVFPFIPSMNLGHSLKRELLKNEFVGGYSISGEAETAFERANGTKGIESYKGLNVFVVKFNSAMKGADKLADLLYDFLLARLDNLNEPFYFYNSTERWTPDLTGADAIGRYLVVLKDPNVVVSREYFRNCLFSYGVEFIEQREFVSGIPISFLPWGSCPITSVAISETKIWYFTTDEIAAWTDNPLDTLYIIQYDLETGLWTVVYSDTVVFDDFGYHEPGIGYAIRGNVVSVMYYLRDFNEFPTNYRYKVITFVNGVLENVTVILPEGTEQIIPIARSYATMTIDNSEYIHFFGLVNDSPSPAWTKSTLYDYVSTDSGATFTRYKVGDFFRTSTSYNPFSVVTTAGGDIYVCAVFPAFGSAVATTYIYRSTDNGETWAQLAAATGVTKTITYLNGIFFKIYGVYNGGLYDLYIATSANGTTWTNRQFLFQEAGDDAFDTAAFIFTGSLYYVFVSRSYTGFSGNYIEVWRSADGFSWSLISTISPGGSLDNANHISPSFYGSLLVVTAYYLETILAGQPTVYMLSLYYSLDDGVSWTLVQTPFYDITTGGTAPV